MNPRATTDRRDGGTQLKKCSTHHTYFPTETKHRPLSEHNHPDQGRCDRCIAAYNKAHNVTNNPKNNPKNWELATAAKILYGTHRVRKEAHGRYVKADFTPEEQAAIEAKAQSGNAGRGKRQSKPSRTWTDQFTPQVYGGPNTGGKRVGKPRSNPDPVLYAGHLFTGYIKDNLVVVMKTGKSDHFEYERRMQARTFGIEMTVFDTLKVAKEKQAKAEIDRRNALRLLIRENYKVYHFGENDAIVIDSPKEESTVVSAYFTAAKRAAEEVIA